MRPLGILALAVLASCGASRSRIQTEAAPEYATREGRNEVRLDVAEALLDQRRPAAAREVLMSALTEGADPHEVELLQARALAMEGLMPEAEELFLSASKGMPRDPRPWRELGLAQAERGDLEQAERSFSRATELDANDAATWNNFGFVLLSQKKYPEARSALARAVTLDGQTPRYRMNLGFALAAIGRESDALQAFRGAVVEAEAQYNLGVALELLGVQDRAVVHYRKAVEAAPTHPLAVDALHRLDTPSEEKP